MTHSGQQKLTKSIAATSDSHADDPMLLPSFTKVIQPLRRSVKEASAANSIRKSSSKKAATDRSNIFNLWKKILENKDPLFNSYLFCKLKIMDLFPPSGYEPRASKNGHIFGLEVDDNDPKFIFIAKKRENYRFKSFFRAFFGIPADYVKNSFSWWMFGISVVTVIPMLIRILVINLLKLLEFFLFFLRRILVVRSYAWGWDNLTNPGFSWIYTLGVVPIFLFVITLCSFFFYQALAAAELIISLMTSPIKNFKEVWSSNLFGSPLFAKICAVIGTIISIAAIAAICVFAPYVIALVLGYFGGFFATVGSFLLSTISAIASIVPVAWMAWLSGIVVVKAAAEATFVVLPIVMLGAVMFNYSDYKNGLSEAKQLQQSEPNFVGSELGFAEENIDQAIDTKEEEVKDATLEVNSLGSTGSLLSQLGDQDIDDSNLHGSLPSHKYGTAGESSEYGHYSSTSSLPTQSPILSQHSELGSSAPASDPASTSVLSNDNDQK